MPHTLYLSIGSSCCSWLSRMVWYSFSYFFSFLVGTCRQQGKACDTGRSFKNTVKPLASPGSMPHLRPGRGWEELDAGPVNLSSPSPESALFRLRGSQSRSRPPRKLPQVIRKRAWPYHKQTVFFFFTKMSCTLVIHVL